MEVRVIEITASAMTHGRLNIRACGRAFFPSGAFGSSSRARGSGERVRLRVRGIPKVVLTDIPTDQKGRPRWFFRERSWIKDFVKLHRLHPGSKVSVCRVSANEYEIMPGVPVEVHNGTLFPKISIAHSAVGCSADLSITPVSVAPRRGRNGDLNKLVDEDRPVHDWYRFVLSFPPHLVRDYLHRFGLNSRHRVLDPFCGTGTTVVECQKMGVPAIGIEANTLAYFASKTKIDWNVDPEKLEEHASEIAVQAQRALSRQGFKDGGAPLSNPDRLRKLSPDVEKLILTNSISPIPLHKTLVLLKVIERYRDSSFYDHERLALAKSVVFTTSNLHFGPEVGVGKPKLDAPVVDSWLSGVTAMARDIRDLNKPRITSNIINADSRQLASLLEPESIDAVITSPPYPNEKDYTRTTRLESVLLGFIRSKAELQTLKKSLVRSNTRSVYKGDDDDKWISEHPEIQRIADAIETRRLELGKTSGFERMYHRVAKLYFGGMARHLAELRSVLRPGAHLAYVVGDQASYLRVMIRTGELLAKIGSSLGYEIVNIDLFRTRLATATKEQLREEVVIMRWPGISGRIGRGRVVRGRDKNGR